MKTVAYWQWLIPTPTNRGTTIKEARYRKDEAAALAAHPGAVMVLQPMELRSVAETDADMPASFTGAWLQTK